MNEVKPTISRWHIGNAISAVTLALFVIILTTVVGDGDERRMAFTFGQYGLSVALLLGSYAVLVRRSSFGTAMLSMAWAAGLGFYFALYMVLGSLPPSLVQEGQRGAVVFIGLLLLWCVIGCVVAAIGVTHDDDKMRAAQGQ